jgi:hypothetical protein
MDGAMVDGEASSASHAAATRIQNAWRRRRAVKRFLSLLAAAQRQQQEERAARLVQGLFRKVKAKRKFAELIQAVKEQKAATMLQRNARSFVFRQQSRMQVDETSFRQRNVSLQVPSPAYGDLTGIYRILNGIMAKLVQRGSSITVTVLPPSSAIWSPARGVVEDGGRVSLRFGTFGMDVAKLKTSRVPHELLWADGSSWVQISTDIAGYTPRPLSKTPPPRPASGSFLRPITPKMFRKRMGF